MLVERGDKKKNMERGRERTHLEGERGVEGQPCNQSRELIMGEVGDSNGVKEILRGGWGNRSEQRCRM